MQDDDAVGFLHRVRDGFFVQRRDRSQVDNLEFDTVPCQNVGGFLRNVDHCGIGDHAKVASFAMSARFADIDCVVFAGQLFLDAPV